MFFKIMNWYKIAQQVKSKKLTYHDIGHSDYEGDYNEAVEPYIIWIYYDGDVLAVEETEKTPTHQDAFSFIPDIDRDISYYGRYDPNTEKLSLAKPVRGIQQHRDIPSRLIYLLNRKFNEPIMHVF